MGELTAFLRHYLAYRNGVLCNEEHVYARFRDRIEANFPETAEFEQEVITLQRFALYYDRFLRPQNEPDKDIQQGLERLNILELSTGYPLMLGLYDSYQEKKIDKNQFLESLTILENYIVRRYLTGEPTNYLNKVFPTLWKDIDTTNFIPSLKEVILQKNYPADYAIEQKGQTRRLYDTTSSTRAKTVLVLETINRHLSLRENRDGYDVLKSEPTIEHILPQTPSEEWKADIGDNFNVVYDQYLHTIGNLTLVTSEWNIDLSNSAFSTKKTKLAKHALSLNHQYFQQPISCWNDKAIQARAKCLLSLVLEIWPAIGEIPGPGNATGIKPVKLVLLGQEFPVTSWRDVMEKTVENVAPLVDSFDSLGAAFPAFLAKEPFAGRCRQISNGWYLYVNLSANAIKNFCRSLITKVGLAPSDWQVEER